MAGHQSLFMHYVYILRSITDKTKIYKGSTQNLTKRITQHNSGQVPHTSKYKPWKIIYYSVFVNKKKAIQFEKYLKTASGIAFMRKRLI